MIFHFPTFPDPCCVAVLAGEKITTCNPFPIQRNHQKPFPKTQSELPQVSPRDQNRKNEKTRGTNLSSSKERKIGSRTLRWRCSWGIPEAMPISPGLMTSNASAENGRDPLMKVDRRALPWREMRRREEAIAVTPMN